METCDVLIVGGGPAGSSCARRLHKAGLDVIVLDKSDFPRDKVCAGWITPAVVTQLELDLERYRKEHVCQDILGFWTGTTDGNGTYNTFESTVSYGIRRFEFDHYLLSRSGARLLLNTPVKELSKEGHGWLVNGEIRSNMLVGAGGHFCPVARYLGAKIGKSERSVSAREVEINMSGTQASECQIEAKVPELFFYPDLSGYGWVFRKGNYLNIGVGREDTNRITAVADDFISFLQQQQKIPTDLAIDFKGHAYLLYDHAQRRIFDDSVVLIGDAAGLAYTQSGEGIRPAIESGLLAAECILEARGDYSAHKLRRYQGSIVSRYGDRHPQDHHWLPTHIRHTLARKVINNRFLSRHLLLERYFLRNAVGTL